MREREREREKWNTFNTKFVLLGSASLLTQTCSSSNQLKVKLPRLIADRGQHLGKFPFSLLTPPLHSTTLYLPRVSNIQVLKSFKCLTQVSVSLQQRFITLQIVLLALYLKQTLYPSQRQLTGVSFILLWVLTSELDKYIWTVQLSRNPWIFKLMLVKPLQVWWDFYHIIGRLNCQSGR